MIYTCILFTGIVSGLSGPNRRTVAAHLVPNGLTSIKTIHKILHGETVAYDILVWLRLEEIMQKNHLPFISKKLLKFYKQVSLSKSLEDLGLDKIIVKELNFLTKIICHLNSDIHRLLFALS